MTISASVTVQDGSGSPIDPTGVGADVTPGATITVRLASTAGVDAWELSVIGTDETISVPTLAVNATTKVATYTAPGLTGTATIFKSRVTSQNGKDPNTNRSPYVVEQTFGVYTLVSGQRVGSINETLEGNASFGWVPKLNHVIRTGGGGGASFTVDTANVSSGDVIVKLANGHVQTATSSVLASNVAPFGIATSSGLVGGSVTAAASGIVDASVVPTVGTSNASPYVTIDATGKPVRLLYPTGGEVLIGVADSHGNVTVSPVARRGQPSPAHVLNPRAFGCPWDGIHDDLPGFQAMLASIPKTGTNTAGGATIQLPPGQGYFSGDLEIARPVHIRGYGSGGGPSGDSPDVSGMHFAPGRGIKIQGPLVSSDGGNGDNTCIENVVLISKQLIPNDNAHYISRSFFAGQHVAGEYIELGDCIRYSAGTNTSVFFRVTVAGVNGATEPPAFATTTDPGITITSGGVTYVSECFPHDYIPGHHYKQGERIFVVGDTRYYFECVQEGDAGGAAINPDPDVGSIFSAPKLPPDDTDIIDNTCKWRVKTHCGILVRAAEVVLRNIYYAGWTGYCVHAQSSTGFGLTNSAGCNLLRSFGGKAEECGGAICLYGVDAGLAHIESIYGINMGDRARTNYGPPFGTGAHVVYDNGPVNNFYSLYGANTHSTPNYFATGNSGGKFFGCHSEGVDDLFRTPTIMQFAGGQSYQPTSNHIAITAFGGQNLFEINRLVSPNITAYAGVIGGTIARIHGIQSGDEAPGAFAAWEYQIARQCNDHSATPYTGGTGWYTFGWGYNLNIATSGFSGAEAAEGEGHWREYEGHFCGGTNPYWDGNNPNSLGWGQLRNGEIKKGDRWRNINGGQPGDYDTAIATADGAIGQRWVSGTTGTYYWQHITSGTYTGRMADCVVPTTAAMPIPAAQTRVFRVQSTTGGAIGFTGPAEPNWALVPPGGTVVDGDITWEDIGTVPDFAYADPGVMRGTLPLAVDTALSPLQAAYENILVTVSGKTITVTTPRDGQTLRVYNASAGNITVVGFTVGAGQLLVADYIGSTVAAWKKQSLV